MAMTSFLPKPKRILFKEGEYYAMDTRTPYQVANDAIDYLERFGWAKESWSDGHSRCLMGATYPGKQSTNGEGENELASCDIADVVFMSEPTKRFAGVAYEIISAEFPERANRSASRSDTDIDRVTYFNDHEETGIADVLWVLEKTRAKLAEEV